MMIFITQIVNIIIMNYLNYYYYYNVFEIFLISLVFIIIKKLYSVHYDEIENENELNVMEESISDIVGIGMIY